MVINRNSCETSDLCLFSNPEVKQETYPKSEFSEATAMISTFHTASFSIKSLHSVKAHSAGIGASGANPCTTRSELPCPYAVDTTTRTYVLLASLQNTYPRSLHILRCIVIKKSLLKYEIETK